MTQQSSAPLNNCSRGGRLNGHDGRYSGRGGRGRGRYSGFQCQVCHRYGHIAFNCFYRFQEDYPPVAPLEFHAMNNTATGITNSAPNTVQAPASYNSNPYQYVHPQQQHQQVATTPAPQGILGPCPLNNLPQTQPPAAYNMIAAPHVQNFSMWYPDSGATNHVTNYSPNIRQTTSF